MDKIIDILASLLDWVQNNETTLLILGVLSILTFVGTLILVPVLVVRLPADYFAHRGKHRKPWLSVPPILRIFLLILKNILGLILLFAGLFMLVLPGQGILTILIGLTLLNFPGKFRFERWLVTREPVRRSVNWLRRRAGREPLVLFSKKETRPSE